jgi:hypothetical protein
MGKKIERLHGFDLISRGKARQIAGQRGGIARNVHEARRGKAK